MLCGIFLKKEKCVHKENMFRFILTLKESRKLYPWYLLVLKQGFAKVINCWTNRFGAFDYHKVEKYDVEIMCRDFRIFFFFFHLFYWNSLE